MQHYKELVCGGRGLGLETAIRSLWARIHLITTMGKIKKKFYAVRAGRNVGIYNSWSDCEAQVRKFPGAKFKSFAELAEADHFVHCSDSDYKALYGRKSRVAGAGKGGRKSNATTNPTSYNSSGTGPITKPILVPVAPTPGSLARDRYFGNITSRYFSSGGGGGGPSGAAVAVTAVGVDGSCMNGSHGTAVVQVEHHHRPVVYSDGSCTNNGLAVARAGVGVYWGSGSVHNVSERLAGYQSNQRAELVSACRALESAIQQGFPAVEVRTDSTYTIKAATQWIDKWKKNGWRTAARGDVKNQADLQRLDDLCKRVDVKWTHVNGHVGIVGNESADALAKLGAKKDLT